MNNVVSKNPVEASQVALAAYKSVLSDYALRARQAEDMVSTLMNDKIPAEQMVSIVVPKIMEHMRVRELERATQYLGVMQSSLLVLNELAGCTTDEATRTGLVEVIKGLTLTTNH